MSALELAHGNPGAISVVAKLLNGCGCAKALHTLAELNITGPLIWVLYKDACACDIELMKTVLETKDVDALAVVERERKAMEDYERKD